MGVMPESSISGYFTEIKIRVVATISQPEVVWTCLPQIETTAIARVPEPKSRRKHLCAMRSPQSSGGNMAHLLLALQTAGCFLGLVKAHRELDRRELRRLRLLKLAPGPGRGGHNSIGARDGYKKTASEDNVHATAWYGILLREPTISDPTSKTHQEFVSEFRVPYQVFVEIVEGCQGMHWAKTFTATRKKRRGTPPTPIEVKVLSALYRLGSGSIPRTISRLFNISTSLNDQFFKDFCAHYAQKYEEYCRPPSSDDEIREVEEVYSKMGLPWCVGSTDGVHVAWSSCPSALLSRHKGAKGMPTRSFNVTVDHRRFIHAVASSKPGTINDKTAVRYDQYLCTVRQGRYSQYRYTLNGESRSGAD